MNGSSGELFQRGIELLEKGDCLSALSAFEKSLVTNGHTAACQSYISFLKATERGQLNAAISELEHLAGKAPDEPAVYLNLGKLYLKAGRKSQAIETFRKGLGCGKLPEAIRMLEQLGTRKPPVFKFLSRDHFLNKYSGKLFKKLGLR